MVVVTVLLAAVVLVVTVLLAAVVVVVTVVAVTIVETEVIVTVVPAAVVVVVTVVKSTFYSDNFAGVGISSYFKFDKQRQSENSWSMEITFDLGISLTTANTNLFKLLFLSTRLINQTLA